MSPKYANTLIYKIKCKDQSVPDFYLGYSTFPLIHVAKMFQVRCKNDHKWPVCEFVRNNGGFENWVFERLDSKPCTTSLEARTELRRHFNANPPSLNKHLPTRTSKEYARGEKNKTAQKTYRTTHREKIHMDQAAHYQKNKERLVMKRREYYLETRELANARVRDYRARRRAARLAEKAAAAAASALIS